MFACLTPRCSLFHHSCYSSVRLMHLIFSPEYYVGISTYHEAPNFAVFSSLLFSNIRSLCEYTLGWPYTVVTWWYCDYFIWCVSCTVVVLTGFVMCGCGYGCGCVCVDVCMCVCFGNTCSCIYCVFVLFLLCILILFMLLFNFVSYVLVFLLLCLCVLIVTYALFCIFCFHCAKWHSSATLTEVFVSFSLSCKTNARV